MKRLMTISLLLALSLVLQAQGKKIVPKMEKGMERTYVTKSTTSVPGQKDVNVTCETKYTVTETTVDGYVLEVVTTSVSSDATPDNIAGQLISAGEELLKDCHIRISTDKNGKPLKILNYDELKAKLTVQCDKFVGKMFEAIPQIQQVMSKDKLKSQIMENVTEEKLVSTLCHTGVLALNGKMVMTGAQEEYVNEQNLKMKRTYFVTENSVVTNSCMNMTKDELKQLIIEKVGELMPEQADMIKQNIDKIMDSGLLKMDMKETATYLLQKDDWLKSVTIEMTNNTMGQQAVSKTTITVK